MCVSYCVFIYTSRHPRHLATGSPQPRAVRTHSHLRPADAVQTDAPEAAAPATGNQRPAEGSDGHEGHGGQEDAEPVPQEATIRSHRMSEDEWSPASASSSHSTGSVKIRHRHRAEEVVQVGACTCFPLLQRAPTSASGPGGTWPARSGGHHGQWRAGRRGDAVVRAGAARCSAEACGRGHDAGSSCVAAGASVGTPITGQCILLTNYTLVCGIPLLCLHFRITMQTESPVLRTSRGDNTDNIRMSGDSDLQAHIASLLHELEASDVELSPVPTHRASVCERGAHGMEASDAECKADSSDHSFNELLQQFRHLGVTLQQDASNDQPTPQPASSSDIASLISSTIRSCGPDGVPHLNDPGLKQRYLPDEAPRHEAHTPGSRCSAAKRSSVQRTLFREDSPDTPTPLEVAAVNQRLRDAGFAQLPPLTVRQCHVLFDNTCSQQQGAAATATAEVVKQLLDGADRRNAVLHSLEQELQQLRQRDATHQHRTAQHEAAMCKQAAATATAAAEQRLMTQLDAERKAKQQVCMLDGSIMWSIMCANCVHDRQSKTCRLLETNRPPCGDSCPASASKPRKPRRQPSAPTKSFDCTPRSRSGSTSGMQRFTHGCSRSWCATRASRLRGQ